jgi:16S rRNA (uracil1498-N3)-methyltransferase
MPRFFATNVQGNSGFISGQELEHLRRVLRLGSGDRITVFDESGREHEAVIRSLDSEQAAIEITRSYEPRRESRLAVTLAMALTKGEKADFVVEKATELGVQTIVPFVSRYSVPKLDERKMSARAERWRKIVVSAAKQSGRTRLPDVLPIRGFAEMISAPWPDTLKLFFWERETTQSMRALRDAGGIDSVFLAVGPEGGFSPEEAAQAEQHGFAIVGLGRRTLRAETAAIAVVAVAQFLWGDLG